MNKYLAKTKGKFCSLTERREQQDIRVYKFFL